jgi:hypothetical protein
MPTVKDCSAASRSSHNSRAPDGNSRTTPASRNRTRSPRRNDWHNMGDRGKCLRCNDCEIAVAAAPGPANPRGPPTRLPQAGRIHPQHRTTPTPRRPEEQGQKLSSDFLSVGFLPWRQTYLRRVPGRGWRKCRDCPMPLPSFQALHNGERNTIKHTAMNFSAFAFVAARRSQPMMAKRPNSFRLCWSAGWRVVRLETRSEEIDRVARRWAQRWCQYAQSERRSTSSIVAGHRALCLTPRSYCSWLRVC